MGGKKKSSPISVLPTLYILLLGVIIGERKTHASTGGEEPDCSKKACFFLSSYKENIFLLEELFISKIRMIDMGIFHIRREFCGIIEAETMQIIQKS